MPTPEPPNYQPPSTVEDLIQRYFLGERYFARTAVKGVLSDLSFADACFVEADLEWCYFFRCDIERADFTDAYLSSSCLRSARWAGAKFVRTNFTASTIANGDLTQPDFESACADFECKIGLSSLKDTAAGLVERPHRQSAVERFLTDCGYLEREDITFFRSLVRRQLGRQRACRVASNMTAFLSHSHKDKSLVRSLERRLSAQGVKCWLDEIDLVSRDDLKSRFAAAVQECQTLILCDSASARRSSWVDFEATRAIEKVNAGVRHETIYIALDDHLLTSRRGARLKGNHMVFDFVGAESDLEKFELQCDILASHIANIRRRGGDNYVIWIEESRE